MRVNLVHLAVNAHAGIYTDVIEILDHALSEAGVPTRRSVNQLRKGWINLLVGHLMFLPPRELACMREHAATCVVLQSEPLAPLLASVPDAPGYLALLRDAAQVWDYSAANLPLMETHGVRRARLLPLGYCPRLARALPAAEPDIDVLFIGVTSDRRRTLFDRIAATGATLRVGFGVYGPHRDALVPRARIHLNIHQFPQPHLEQVRLAYLLANRAFVVSETSEADPYGGGVIFAEYEDIPDVCADWLRRPRAERDAVATRGEMALRRMPLTETVGRAIREL